MELVSKTRCSARELEQRLWLQYQLFAHQLDESLKGWAASRSSTKALYTEVEEDRLEHKSIHCRQSTSSRTVKASL